MILAIQTSSSLVMTKYFVCLFLNENGRHNSGDRKKRYYVVQLWRQCFSLHFKALIFPLREWKFKKEVEVVICQFPRRVTSTVHFTDQHLIFIFNLFLPTLLIFEVIRLVITTVFLEFSLSLQMLGYATRHGHVLRPLYLLTRRSKR